MNHVYNPLRTALINVFFFFFWVVVTVPNKSKISHHVEDTPVTVRFSPPARGATPCVFILRGLLLVDSAEQEVGGRYEHTVVPLTSLALSSLPFQSFFP